MQIRILLGTPLKKVKKMKNKAVKIGIVASILPHLFCCVLPIVLSLIGLFAPEVAHTAFIPEWIEPWLFVFSATAPFPVGADPCVRPLKRPCE